MVFITPISKFVNSLRNIYSTGLEWIFLIGMKNFGC